MQSTPLKALFWTNTPTHLQSRFIAALQAAGVDLEVCYYGRVRPDRLALGWEAFDTISPNEHYVEPSLKALEVVPDWHDRVHIVPGFRSAFLRRLVARLNRSHAEWAHWSEPSHPGLRWWLSLPEKRRYAGLVNKYALGAFAVGSLAEKDFARWGIDMTKVTFLPYSLGGYDPDVPPDTQCVSFCRGRSAFAFTGQLCRRKAVDVLLNAFARVSDTAPWVLLLVGNDRSGGAYERQARRLGIEQRVLFRGPVPAGNIAGVLRTAKVLTLPSRHDGWGAPLNEGASMGLALVATDRVGAAYHLIDPAVNGFRVRAGSSADLALALNAYVKSRELADRHGAESLRLFQSLTPERNAERFVRTIESWRALRGGREIRSGQSDDRLRLHGVHSVTRRGTVQITEANISERNKL